jgi:phosphoesterase RecJ-like protein
LERPNRPFLEALQSARNILLTGHEHPDGDCLGAQVALFHLLTGMGKEVRILNPDPSPKSFDFLTRHTPFESHEGGPHLPRCDLLVLLDCAEIGRLGRLRIAVERARPRVAVIDHHLGSLQGDGDVAFVDTEAAATGELVHRLFGVLGRPLTRPAAEGVFVSLVSDTGWFRYSNTGARVFEVAAELVRAGVDASRLYDVLNRRNEAESVQLLANAIQRSRISLDGRFGAITLERPVVERGTRIGLDLDLVMEPLRSVGSIEVVAMLKESADGGVKISLRASREVDVQRIARRFGGGGHKKAAGASVRGTLESVLVEVEAAVQAALQAPVDGGAGSP